MQRRSLIQAAAAAISLVAGGAAGAKQDVVRTIEQTASRAVTLGKHRHEGTSFAIEFQDLIAPETCHIQVTVWPECVAVRPPYAAALGRDAQKCTRFTVVPQYLTTCVGAAANVQIAIRTKTANRPDRSIHQRPLQ